MDGLQALILGLVEGLTEYLPISSTGHLVLVQRAFGIGQGEAADAYAVVIQAGAILAVLALYARRAGQVLRGLAGRDPAGLRLGRNLLCAFVPAAVLGLLLGPAIKERLFHLPAIAAAWFAGGVALLAFDRWTARRAAGASAGVDDLGWRAAVAIGLAQTLALWPGTSRSLVTILGGVAVGLTLPAAVEFSFLLGVVTLGAATAKDLWSHGDAILRAFGVSSLLLGFAASFVAAALAVKWMTDWIARHGMAVFGWYRVALAAAVAALLATGVL